MRKHITQRLIEKLPLKDQIIRDDRLAGFGIRVSAKGRISFIVEGRIRKGGTVRQTLGKHPSLTVQQARELAREQVGLMDRGVDPREQKKREQEDAKREAARAQVMGVTLAAVLERYLAARTLKSSTHKEYQSTTTLVFSDWLDRPIREITRADIEQRFVATREKRGRATAARSMRYLSAIMNWAMADEIEGERLIRENPCKVLSQKRYERSVKPRERFLSDKEIERLFHYAFVERSWPTRQFVEKYGVAKQQPDGSWRHEKDGVRDQDLNYVLLLLYSGLRKSEALTLRWADVDWNKRLFWVRDTKNHSDHVVPFSDGIEGILKAQLQSAGNSPWVFPSPQSERRHMSHTTGVLDRICRATKLDFTLHDLRRTFATHARIHGSEFDLVKKALNHKSGDITDRYIQGTIELIRPVFEKVARGYMIYSDPQLVHEIENPELYEITEDMANETEAAWQQFLKHNPDWV